MRTLDFTLLNKAFSLRAISTVDGFGACLNVRASLAPPHCGCLSLRVSRRKHMFLKNCASKAGACRDYNICLPYGKDRVASTNGQVCGWVTGTTTQGSGLETWWAQLGWVAGVHSVLQWRDGDKLKLGEIDPEEGPATQALAGRQAVVLSWRDCA